jgi:hypothetical protein
MSSRAILLSLSLAVACGGHSVSSPVLRVDLRDRLPPKLQRQVAKADSSYPCTHRFSLAAEGASQRFLVGYRVLDDGASKHVTALEVDPEGETSGASAPSATAAVAGIRQASGVSVVSVRVSWEASKGCNKVGASTTVELRADGPGCRPPRPIKLLTPVR